MAISISGTTLTFNDATTQTTAAVVSTSTVLSATAGASLGAVGTYAFLGGGSTNTTYVAGSTYAGSGLRYAGASKSTFSFNSTAYRGLVSGGTVGGTPSGTWRAMGNAQAITCGCGGTENPAGITLFLRTV